MNTDERLQKELASFNGIWKGGYYEGDPLNPLGRSGYKQLGYMSMLHATYLRCIKPYINSETVALEIGAGRGAWTKALLPSKEVYVLDALPQEYNRFFEYLNYPTNVRYIQVQDFKCKMLPDNHFNYMFSFGCLCHVPFEGIREYAINLYPKLKPQSNCFWMIADYNKYNYTLENLNRFSAWSILMPTRRRYLPLKWLLKYLMKREKWQKMRIDGDERKWHNAGIERTCSMLKEIGYQVLDSDVGTNLRDPIIHFTKS